MFSDNYIRLCKEKGVGVTVASQEIGFSANSGKKWSEGSVPRKTTLLKIAEYFGVTVDELMEGQPTMSYGDAPLLDMKKAATPKDDGALLRFALFRHNSTRTKKHPGTIYGSGAFRLLA